MTRFPQIRQTDRRTYDILSLLARIGYGVAMTGQINIATPLLRRTERVTTLSAR